MKSINGKQTTLVSNLRRKLFNFLALFLILLLKRENLKYKKCYLIINVSFLFSTSDNRMPKTAHFAQAPNWPIVNKLKV